MTIQEKKTKELTIAELQKFIKGSDYINFDVAEDGKKLVISLDQDCVDFLFPIEVADADITTTIAESSTTIEVDGLDETNGYTIYLEIEGSGTHAGASFTVFPYNSATCLTPFKLVLDSEVDCYGSLDENGKLNISVDAALGENDIVKVHYKRVI